MVMKIETENEQLILVAAEKEFLEKGYNGAKTIAIAQRAGVTHAMLHYYFRTKENLFQIVFCKKVQQIGASLESRLDESKSFEENITNFIRAHFEFIKENPRIFNFVYNEVYSNKEDREFFHDAIFPTIYRVFSKVSKMAADEAAKGAIRKIDPMQLFLNILSLDVMTFVAYPIIKEYSEDKTASHYEELLKEREDNIIDLIIRSLKK